MCGIAGFYGFRDDNLIKKFSKILKHRGPDGEGYEIDDRVTMLSRRLAIIDVKGGWQPLYNETKSVAVVYNGEMYNYRELRTQLEKKGHTFKTKSDTEVIAHGYEEWGEKCFDKFNAMFGVAVYDKKKKRLLLARDHFGIKPMYYILKAGPGPALIPTSAPQEKPDMRAVGVPFARATRYSIVFSSEIKPLLQSGILKAKVNEKVLYRYLRYRIHDDSPETFFEGIYKLMPGEVMIVEEDKITIKKYSNLEKELLEMKGNKIVDEQAVKTFQEKLTQAVRGRLISEVPVGTCLSGGLDSSTVVALTNQLLKEKVKEAESVGRIQKTFSAVFPGARNDEEKYVDAVINKVKNVLEYKIKPTPEMFFQELEDFVRTQEEPTISTGPYAQYKVMEEVHKHVTVVLDGQGADEMMAGYLPYYFVYFRQLWNDKKIDTLIRELISSKDILIKYFKMKLVRIIGLKRDISVIRLLNSKYNVTHSHEKFKTTSNNLKKRLIEDIFYNSLPALLRYEDKNSMRFSIEGRVPFLDFNLIRYLFSLTDEAIIYGGWNKNILRKAVDGDLPDEIVKRRNKIGFTTPEYEWFMRMKNKIYGIFLSESFANRPYFNQPEVLKSFEEFIQGKNDDTLPFWRLLNVEMWLREFIDPPSSKIKKDSGRDKSSLPYQINEGKKLEINLEEKEFKRYPLRTELFENGDDFSKKITDQVTKFINKIEMKEKWFVVVSEKVVAISQGRSYFIWDIKPTFFARLFSTFVKKTPYGIGLGSPWTMQIAIDEVGLPRIAFASFVSVITKPFGMRGMFYKIAGETVRSIDGPTEYSLYPSNVSAKLGPKDPKFAAHKISTSIVEKLTEKNKKNFQGAVIIDSNDLGRNVLGNATAIPSSKIEAIFKDNPMGQGSEQTPVVVVCYNS